MQQTVTELIRLRARTKRLLSNIKKLRTNWLNNLFDIHSHGFGASRLLSQLWKLWDGNWRNDQHLSLGRQGHFCDQHFSSKFICLQISHFSFSVPRTSFPLFSYVVKMYSAIFIYSADSLQIHDYKCSWRRDCHFLFLIY